MRALALSLLIVSAGCLAATDATAPPAGDSTAASFVPPAPEFDFSTLVVTEHAHDVAELHDASHGLALAGLAPVGTILPEGMPGSISSIDVHGGYAAVAGAKGGLGFALVDVRDPTAPATVGWYGSQADGMGVRFSGDGTIVFYACQIAFRIATSQVRGDCEDPDAIHPPNSVANGVVAVDVTDPTAPRQVAVVETSGAHNIIQWNVDGVDYVATDDGEIIRYDAANASFEILTQVPAVHDVSVAQHPVTGQWLMYAGGDPFFVYDVTDPAAPTPIYEGGMEGVTGWHEQTPFPGLVDGRALLALGGESALSPGRAAGVVAIVDVTDPANPALLGEWVPPFAPRAPWHSYAFSIHEMAATPTGQLAVAWYHAGVWVIDVSTRERQESPVTLGAYQPSEAANVVPAPSPDGLHAAAWVPDVWGAGWDARGYLLIPDRNTGVHVLEPEWGLHAGADGGN